MSLLLAVDKQPGMSSHDVVNRCRRIFGERRVGHTGTLDPLASGLLPICIGPATRLDKYLAGHDKEYRVTIGFGYETTTDDMCGDVTVACAIPERLSDESYAAAYLESLVGEHEQMPPQFSAIKVNGVKSYEAARKGKSVDLAARRISILKANLVEVRLDLENGALCWDAVFRVSKGTYIRSIARDIGRELGTRAHVRALRRLASGRMDIREAHSLEDIERKGRDSAIDPVRALGFRFAIADDLEHKVNAGNALECERLVIHEAPHGDFEDTMRAESPHDGEFVSIVVGNTLKALYRFDSSSSLWKPDCVFSIGVDLPENGLIL